MPHSDYERIERMLMDAQVYVQLIDHHPDGRTSVYTVRNAEEFRAQRGKSKAERDGWHEHKVYRQDKLIHHRDRNGRVVMSDDPEQVERNRKAEVLGRGAVGFAGILGDSFRKAVDYNLPGMGFRRGRRRYVLGRCAPPEARGDLPDRERTP